MLQIARRQIDSEIDALTPIEPRKFSREFEDSTNTTLNENTGYFGLSQTVSVSLPRIWRWEWFTFWRAVLRGQAAIAGSACLKSVARNGFAPT